MPTIGLNDVVGSRGEGVFYLATTEYRAFRHPLFRPYFLGEKCPDVDFLVTLWGARGIFFVQVRSTSHALTSTSIRVRLSRPERARFANLPGPTYLAGIHEPSKRCFIRSIDRGSQAGVTSIPLTHELTPGNLQLLYNEVRDFWTMGPYKPQRSVFE